MLILLILNPKCENEVEIYIKFDYFMVSVIAKLVYAIIILKTVLAAGHAHQTPLLLCCLGTISV